MNSLADNIMPTVNQTATTMKHILPMLPPSASPTQVTTTHQITTPITVQTMQTATVQVQPQQQVRFIVFPLKISVRSVKRFKRKIRSISLSFDDYIPLNKKRPYPFGIPLAAN